MLSLSKYFEMGSVNWRNQSKAKKKIIKNVVVDRNEPWSSSSWRQPEEAVTVGTGRSICYWSERALIVSPRITSLSPLATSDRDFVCTQEEGVFVVPGVGGGVGHGGGGGAG